MIKLGVMNPGWSICLIAACLMAGCMGSPEIGRTAQGLASDDAPPAVSADEWMQATEGCEDVLGPDLDFHEAAGAPELVVCVAPDGRIICVDTAAAIEEELAEMGEELLLGTGQHPGALTEPQTGGKGFYPTSSRASSSPTEGDPSPQPSQEAGSAADAAGDPSPQPSTVAAGDPSPQPSQEASAAQEGASSGDPSPQPSSDEDSVETNAEMDGGEVTTALDDADADDDS